MAPRLAARSGAYFGVREEVLVRDIDAAPAQKLVLEPGSGHAVDPTYLRR